MTEEYKLQNGEGGCFACINSGQGFRSYFDTFLGKMQYVYVIKGGPGTGKSGFMRRIRKEAQKRGEESLPIFCSSDPESLDGLILKERRIAFVDGTSPHVQEPAQPGFRPAPGIQKPVDIRSNVQEKTLKIPDFLQRK